MRTVLDVVPISGLTDEQIAVQFTTRVAKAYAALFSGTGGSEDAELVLVDLAQFTRYYDTASLEVPAEHVKALDQRRAVFQRIAEALTKSGKTLGDLHGAVLRAPPID